MASAKRKEMWIHTSNLMALIFNRTRFFSKERQKSPSDFNPYDAKRKKPASVKEKFAAMKQRFMAFVQRTPLTQEEIDGIRK